MTKRASDQKRNAADKRPRSETDSQEPQTENGGDIATEETEAEERFNADLRTREEAVELEAGITPGEADLPPGATHEIVREEGETKLKRRRFSAF